MRLVDDHRNELGIVNWSQAQAHALELRADLVALDTDTDPPTYIATRLGERLRQRPRERPDHSWPGPPGGAGAGRRPRKRR